MSQQDRGTNTFEKAYAKMSARIAKIVERHADLERQMATPEVLTDYTRLAELAQERTELQPIVNGYVERQAPGQELADTRELLTMSEEVEFIEMADRTAGTRKITKLDKKLRRMLISEKIPRDDKSVIMEIRAGAGGDEAAIFAVFAHVHAL